MEKKYELIESDIKGLYRIKALCDFSDVKKGNIGGYVESEDNLSQDDDCWIYYDSKVFDNAKVFGNAAVFGGAIVRNNATVCGNAQIFDNVIVSGDAVVCHNANIYGNAMVCGNAWIGENATVRGNAQVFGRVIVSGDAIVLDNAKVYGDVCIYGSVTICGNATVSSIKDYIVFKNFWSSGRYFTWTKSNNMWRVGCFYGSGEELIKKAYNDSEVSGRNYEAVVKYVEGIINLNK